MEVDTTSSPLIASVNDVEMQDVEGLGMDHRIFSAPEAVSGPSVDWPDDILSEIFHHYFQFRLSLPDNTLARSEPCANDVNDPPIALQGQLVLAHVCQQWRYLVFNTSNLWTHLSFGFAPRAWADREHIPPLDPYISLDELACRLWLKNSGASPLHITLAGSSSQADLKGH
jgi:hypothetical protein